MVASSPRLAQVDKAFPTVFLPVVSLHCDPPIPRRHPRLMGHHTGDQGEETEGGQEVPHDQAVVVGNHQDLEVKNSLLNSLLGKKKLLQKAQNSFFGAG